MNPSRLAAGPDSKEAIRAALGDAWSPADNARHLTLSHDRHHVDGVKRGLEARRDRGS